VLFFAASNDLVAKWFAIAVEDVTLIYRILLFALPALLGWGTYRLMKALAYSGVERFREMPLAALRLKGPSA